MLANKYTRRMFVFYLALLKSNLLLAGPFFTSSSRLFFDQDSSLHHKSLPSTAIYFEVLYPGPTEESLEVTVGTDFSIGLFQDCFGQSSLWRSSVPPYQSNCHDGGYTCH